jgi:predicted alpha/beta superfamily hydrolase
MTVLRRRLTAAFAALSFALLALAARAQPAAPPPAPARPSAAEAAGHPAEITLPDTRRIAFTSKVNGHGYSIDVFLPVLPPPPKGYPVIYVLDGDAYFPSAMAAVEAGNLNAVVVGIGYPHDPAWIDAELKRHGPIGGLLAQAPPFDRAVSLAREYDMSLPGDADTIKSMALAGAVMTEKDFGGLDDYLKVIETDIKPRVYGLAPIDKDNQTLFGHSLGGLAVVEAMFTEPGAFRNFVAASPSIWWAGRAVLKNEAAFDAAVAGGRAAPRILVTVGAEEETVPKLPPEYEKMLPQVKAEIEKARMVGNACDLAARLKALHGAPGYAVADCAVFQNLGHQLSPWPAIARTVAFVDGE